VTLVHLVYPSDTPARTPGAIGWHLRRALVESGYEVETYDWTDSGKINPGPDDILLGHPHPSPFTVFRRSISQSGWKRKVAIFPMSGEVFQYAYAYESMLKADVVLAIMGPEWADYASLNPDLRAIHSKLCFLDLAIDASLFPVLDDRATYPSARAILYVGHTGGYKSPEYLEEIRRLLPHRKFGWIGSGERELSGFVQHGVQDLQSGDARRILNGYHILLMAGYGDANPTAVIEGMALGLLPACTRGTGWSTNQGVVRIPSTSAREAAEIIESLATMDSDAFVARINKNRRLVEGNFHWASFAAKVISALEGPTHSSRAHPEVRTRAMMIFAQAVAAIVGPRIAPAHIAGLLTKNAMQKLRKGTI